MRSEERSGDVDPALCGRLDELVQQVTHETVDLIADRPNLFDV